MGVALAAGMGGIFNISEAVGKRICLMDLSTNNMSNSIANFTCVFFLGGGRGS